MDYRTVLKNNIRDLENDLCKCDSVIAECNQIITKNKNEIAFYNLTIDEIDDRRMKIAMAKAQLRETAGRMNDLNDRINSLQEELDKQERQR